MKKKNPNIAAQLYNERCAEIREEIEKSKFAKRVVYSRIGQAAIRHLDLLPSVVSAAEKRFGV